MRSSVRRNLAYCLVRMAEEQPQIEAEPGRISVWEGECLRAVQGVALTMARTKDLDAFPREFVTARELTMLLGVNRARISAMLKQGQLKAERLGGSGALMFDPEVAWSLYQERKAHGANLKHGGWPLGRMRRKTLPDATEKPQK